ncbi:nuclear transport factor 2 family protein [Microbacterium suaedae]|uniref:nuclear transport factor 2 family protein n=1 Tax=Microbacterium suaedae TaxID=2067813 RepID=UPI000DA1680F|nr:nuclear transport factor 2 family protein [Microbacterium suaedae]
MTNRSALAAVRDLHRILESGRVGEGLRDLFHSDAEVIEHPHALKPNGHRSGLDQLIAASVTGAGMLRSQSYEELSAIADEEHVSVRVRWSGVVAAEVGPFAAGQELIAHVAQFATVVGGRILRLETYDCYEPF